MKRFVKLPIEIEAIIFDGSNFKECELLIGRNNFDNTLNYPNIITSEGVMAVDKGDYIIKEPFDKERGFYPCKPDVFKKTYKEASMKYTERFASSRTVRKAFYLKLGGVLSIIAANVGYFEDRVPAYVIGGIMILNGVYDYFLRVDTSANIK